MHLIVASLVLMLSGCTVSTVKLPVISNDLPDYVVINDDTCKNKDVLRLKAKRFKFPLNKEDLYDIAVLNAKYEQEENCAGLAAPQIGISKAIIIFEVQNDAELKKWRPDLTQGMEKSIWLNPSYTPISEEKHRDYEGCFSVKDTAAAVERYKKIKYQACDLDGNLIEGTAEGFLARAIQHEIDHINGILYIDIAVPGTTMSMDEYRKIRRSTMKSAD